VPYKVLIVDDSSFFQHRLKEIISECPDLQVVGIASNGQEAIEKAASLNPDIISMDYEMPFLNGVSAVRAIMAERPVPIVMFSSMTYEGAKITLEALEAGAVDFIPKNFAEVSTNSAVLKKRLHEKLVTFASQANLAPVRSTDELAAQAAVRSQRAKEKTAALRERIAKKTELSRTTKGASSGGLKGKVKLVAIGASTGGPVALSDIITGLPSNFPTPVLVIQHMPENFTKAFSERLDKQSSVSVKEAENGDRLGPGKVFIAPGGKQMMLDRTGSTIKIIEGDDRVNYKPCVDITFASLANTFSGKILAVILTGMGSDGCEGARLLKNKGAAIWSQDQESCVVYGMPAAVAKANLSDEIVPLVDFLPRLTSEI